jgi:replicative DNA helicase
MSGNSFPHNIEAEKAIIGAILLDPDTLLIASDMLKPEDFYHERNRLIYIALLDLYDLGEGIELMTLYERLRSKGDLEKAGGVSYLSECATSIPTSANIHYHCKIVAQKALLRRILQWSYQLKDKIPFYEDNPPSLLTEMEQDIITFSEQVREKKNPHISGIIAEIQQTWQKQQDGNFRNIPTGLKFENMIPHFQPGHLWALGGYTSVGKSTLLTQLIADICEKGGKVLVFSLEDSRKEKIIRLIANQTNIPLIRLMTGTIQGFENQISEAIKKIKSWELNIYDDIYTVEEMRLKVKKHKLRSGLDVIAIDYIQNIMGEGSLYDRISTSVIKLQKIAKELEVTCIVISQITNEAMKATSEVIGLKGAGELAAAPDIILWLKRHKDKSKDKWLDCEVRKNRAFGVTGTIPLAFNETWTSIIRRTPGRPHKESEENYDYND